MKNYGYQDVRNVCIVGGQGAGKTSLAEAMLYTSGVISRKGTVEEGNTTLDATPEEIEHKISLQLSISFLEHRDKKINLLTAPGYADFHGDCCAGLSVCEAAILVIAADHGMTPALEDQWQYLAERRIPAVIFLNKIDHENIDFPGTLRMLKERLSRQIVDITVPAPGASPSDGVVNLLDENVPSEDAAYREMMVEDISSGDDALTEEFLEGKQITADELRSTLKKEIRERKVFPLLCGSAVNNRGIKELLDFIADYLPAPQRVEGVDAPSALVFKTVNEPGMGHLNYVRIFSGGIQTGRDIFNLTRQAKERVGQMAFSVGKKRIETHEASAGDIVGIMKLKDTKTNDILGGEKQDVPVKAIEFPQGVYERSLTVASRGDEEKLGSALASIIVENPTISYHFSAETREMVMKGLGALQLDIVAEKLRSRYGIPVVLRAPKVPYRESIRRAVEVQGKYKRQSGGRGQYGDCWLKIEPLERGKGFEFVDKIVGGAIPRSYLPAVEKGIREAMEQGVIAGCPVVDLRATVYDGSYHDVDSSDMAFKIAGAMALRKGVADASPVLLEPIMEVSVAVPDEYMGTILGNLNSRRGRIVGMEKAGSREVVKAEVPLAQMFEYATDLRSLTKGSGRFTMHHSHYEEVPAEIAHVLIDEYQKTRKAEPEKRLSSV